MVAPHVAAHWLPEQTWPLGHVVPHTPQLALSVCVLAQYGAPPSGEQRVMVAPHVAAHWPPEQTWPLGHVVPHTPQFALSFVRVAHVPLQTVWPLGHAVAQVPALQASAAPHTLLQVPQ
jgi:hypothetical protein